VEIKQADHRDDSQFDIKAHVTDHKNGSYDVTYEVPQDIKCEVLQVSVFLRNRHIRGSPFEVFLHPPLMFGETSSFVTKSNGNKTVTNSVNHHFAIGSQAFSHGKHEWKIKIDKLENNTWIFIGIIGEIPQTSNSFQLPTSYGIASMNQLYEAGKISYPNYVTPYTPYFIEGDTIYVSLDCEGNMVTVREGARGIINHRILLPANKSWYPHINLRGRNDQVTIY